MQQSRAAALGFHDPLEQAELALGRANDSTRPKTLRQVADAALSVRNLARTREALEALERSGNAHAIDLQRYARVLEQLGDAAGAFATYTKALEFDARVPGGDSGLTRTRLLLGLRQGVLQRAFAPGDPRRDPRSVFTKLPTIRSLPTSLGPHDPRPWLQLSSMYLQEGQPQLAYRMARAARSVAPDLPEAYAAVGHSALRLPYPGSRELAKLAFQHALKIDPEFSPAVRALSAGGL